MVFPFTIYRFWQYISIALSQCISIAFSLFSAFPEVPVFSAFYAATSTRE